MSLQDSVQLGLCLRACQHEVLAALRLFEMQRIPVTTQEVLEHVPPWNRIKNKCLASPNRGQIQLKRAVIMMQCIQ